MFQTKVEEKIKTHLMFVDLVFPQLAVCEIMWENLIESGRPLVTI